MSWELLRDIDWSSMPFMAAATSLPRNKLDGKRVMEQAITGVVVATIIGAAGYFLAIPVMTKEFQQMQSQLVEMRLEAKEDRLATQAAVQRLTEKQHALEVELARRSMTK